VASDYVYVIQMDDGKVRHMTKVWNDVHALRALGWA
jgi:ketosteroid isomerase-like protein